MVFSSFVLNNGTAAHMSLHLHHAPASGAAETEPNNRYLRRYNTRGTQSSVKALCVEVIG